MATIWRISVLLLTLSLLAVGPALAGTLALEGSDASSLHEDSVYIAQLLGFLKAEGAGLPVLVYRSGGASTLPGAPVDTVYSGSLPAVLIGVHSAAYIQSPGDCCDEAVLSAADQTFLKAFLDAGGSVAIQDYQGQNDIITGFDPPTGEIGGFRSPFATAGGPSCFDTEVFLPDALLKGFTQPGPLGCWGHQAYDLDFFGPLGFVSLVDSGPAFDSLGSGDWSSFLVRGGAISVPGCRLGEVCDTTPGVPSPAALVLLGSGLLGAGVARRFLRR